MTPGDLRGPDQHARWRRTDPNDPLIVGSRRLRLEPMAPLPESARALVDSGRLAHVVTLNDDGSPQVSCVWIAMDNDELVMMHTAEHVKVRNLRRDPRVVVSIGSEERSEGGPHPPFQFHLVVYGT